MGKRDKAGKAAKPDKAGKAARADKAEKFEKADSHPKAGPVTGTAGKNGKSGNKDKLGKSDYLEQLSALEIELNDVARWLQATGKRLMVVVEGRDTAGKGGVINAIAACLNPRTTRPVALPRPTDREQTQWYFQRYVQHLPAAGEIVLFDRSWYNRAGVEAVMGYCTPAQTDAFLKTAPVFEQMLVDDGIMLFKYWLTVDQAMQEERIAERLADPLKRWKLSPIDLQAREKYAAYGKARDRMLQATHTPFAPWTLVDFNDQRRGRLALIRHLLAAVPEHKVPEKRIEVPALSGALLKEKLKPPFLPI